MNSVIYKVIFRAIEQFENKNLTLSFRNIEFEKPISPPANFSKVKKTSEKSHQIINFQNIEEVIIIGNPSVDYSYNYFQVILCVSKFDGKKAGYLIGNVKNLGDIIIGVWPFNIPLKDLTRNKIIDSINDITENPDKFSSICFISQ
ncbi:MAG: hypothetical protein ACFE9C_11500 [Candidatus Hodarchaeota archaeon]